MKVLSLFSGAGGMDIGLEAAGFEVVGDIELDSTATRTLQMNRPGWAGYQGTDILEASKTIKPSQFGLDLGELDLVAGGPPCQPFSLAAQWSRSGRRGIDDERALTVGATMEIVRSFLPKAVLLENVLGFVKGPKAALPAVEEALEDIAQTHGVRYRVAHQLENAADYGVPQNRRRAMIVLIRDRYDWQWPTRTHETLPVRAGDAIDGLEDHELPSPSGGWTDLLPSIPEGWNYQWFTTHGDGPELFGYRTRYWNFLLKLARDRPSWTLAASPGPSTGPFHWDNRPLSVLEAKRLQSFPDHWKLAGDYRAQMKQIGNATPPLLAQAFGREIIRALSGELPSLSLQPFRVRDLGTPAALQPIPEKYRSRVGSKDKHPGHGKGPAPLTEPMSHPADADPHFAG